VSRRADVALTWGSIKQWAPTTLDTAEVDLRTDRRSLLDLADELETMGLPKNWHGDAAEVSRTELRNVTQDLKDLVAEVSAAYAAVCDAADGVRGVELAVDAAAEYATLHDLSISSDGTVTDVGPDIDEGSDHDNEVVKAEREGWVTECVDRIEQALRKANDVDTDLAAVLEKIELNTIHVGRGGLATASKTGAGLGDLSLLTPPAGATPSDNAAWWATMSPDERKEIIAKHPEWIGNRDGVDFTSRDKANRNILDDRREHVSSRMAELTELMAQSRGVAPGGHTTDEYRRLRAEYDDLMEEKGAIAGIDKVLALGGVHQLAGLDFTKGRTEAILVNGNLDDADHVAVFTPGMTSTVGNIGGNDRDMADLSLRIRSALERQDVDDPQVATVTWLGYQAPQMLPDLSVASSSDAEEGGAALADFYRGINASATTDPNLTSLGHSYGSSTVGYALQHENTGVDQAVLFGSPGAATGDIDDYRIPAGTTYYAETADDPVGDLSRFGSDPSSMAGVRELETAAATIEGEDGNPGIHLDRSSGHSEYLDRGTTSQYGIAEIATGSSDNQAVFEDDDQGPVDSFLDDVKDTIGVTAKEEWEYQKGNLDRLGGWVKGWVS